MECTYTCIAILITAVSVVTISEQCKCLQCLHVHNIRRRCECCVYMLHGKRSDVRMGVLHPINTHGGYDKATSMENGYDKATNTENGYYKAINTEDGYYKDTNTERGYYKTIKTGDVYYKTINREDSYEKASREDQVKLTESHDITLRDIFGIIYKKKFESIPLSNNESRYETHCISLPNDKTQFEREEVHINLSTRKNINKTKSRDVIRNSIFAVHTDIDMKRKQNN